MLVIAVVRTLIQWRQGYFIPSVYSKYNLKYETLGKFRPLVTLTMFLILCAVFSVASAATLCTSGNKELVGRVVFGEARGESSLGQLAVAWTIVNRVNNHVFNYPNTVSGVVNQKYGSNHEYNTLDNHHHDVEWARAKASHSDSYRAAITAATGALCGQQPDPTGCATAYCARDPCSATNDTPYAEAYNKVHIGHHYFVCQRPKSG